MLSFLKTKWLFMWVEKLARNIAIFGGLVLTLVALMSVVSIVGRAGVGLGLSSILGDFELVEAGVAFAITSFLPYAHLQHSHAQVAILTDRLGVRANKIIDLISDVLMLIIALLLSWRLALGTIDKYNYLETSFILQYPLWWTYGTSLVGLFTWVIVAFHMVSKSISAFNLKAGAIN